MAWALRAEDRSIIHVSRVTVTGLGCACVCAGCGAPLEAVNADKPPEHFLVPGTLRKSFRHHAGTQRGDCLRRATRAALFQSMLDQKVLMMPPRTAQRLHAGLSGSTYLGKASAAASEQGIKGVQWSDEASALVTLEDGRVVHVVLRSDVTIEARGQGADAVLVITADDPEVAGWSQDEILAKARLTDEWCTWERHWDDHALGERADADARATALQHLDVVPDADPGGLAGAGDEPYAEPEFLASLTPSERGETLLHLHLKRLLSRLSVLEIGSMDFTVDYYPPGGERPLFGTATIRGMRLKILEARLEQRLGSIVPDVLCRSQDMDGRSEAADLIVEVAVTHFVGPEKLQKIRDLDLPCLEFDARRLVGSEASLTMERLEALLRRPPRGAVRWLHHPDLTSRTEEVRAGLRRRHEVQLAEQAEIERRRKEEDRLEAQREAVRVEKRRQLRLLTERVQVMDRRTLLSEYYQEVARRRNVSEERGWSDESYNAYRSGFTRHKVEHWAGEPLQDVLLVLHSIRQAGRRSAAPGMKAEVVGALERVMRVEKHRMRPYLFLLLKAIKIHWTHDVDENHRSKVRFIAHAVKESIDRGESTYAREPALDEPLRLMFPELNDALAIGVPGTLGYANDLAEELQVVRAKRRAERAAQMAQEAEEKAVKKANDVEVALAPARPRQWTRGGGVVFEKWSSYPTAADMTMSEFSLVRRAYEAREAGQSVVDFVRTRGLTDEAAVRALLDVLNKVYLLT